MGNKRNEFKCRFYAKSHRILYCRYTKLDEISKKTQESLEDRGLNVKLAAEASFAGHGSASVGLEGSRMSKDA